MEYMLGKPLRFLLLKVLPDMQNEFLIWAIHQFFHNLMLSMWILHNYVMEPVLGSGCWSSTFVVIQWYVWDPGSCSVSLRSKEKVCVQQLLLVIFHTRLFRFHNSEY